MTRRIDWPRLWAWLQDFVITQFLLVSYLIAITLALAYPAPGRAVGSVQVGGRTGILPLLTMSSVWRTYKLSF